MDAAYEDKKQCWQIYTAAWAQQDRAQRLKMLQQALNAHCTYCDPLVKTEGLDELSDYIDEFQTNTPAGKIVTTAFSFHNYQSLAQWEMLDSMDSLVKSGFAYGRFDFHNRLLVITGFF